MSNYQVLARRYRPQFFREVLGQEAVITTLKNAIKYNRLANAYLFSGSRGTGKTTIARLFAKALNCQQPTDEGEPCNACSSCKEITSGNSLDVLEIDGASHRGIDDIRQINETVGYATSSGKYKIYLIDEVHMLTKEAFNALLKTLEEPPPKVKFFFATTEPHKVLPTILSRCQRFNLSRIASEQIIAKLRRITSELNVPAEEEALAMIAHRAEGGLRDAESLLDQIIAFHEGSITPQTVASALGIMTNDCLFELDREGKQGNFAIAFEIAHAVFSQGKDLIHFVEMLTEHFRHLLLYKLSGRNTLFLELSEKDAARYEKSAPLYSQEQCLTILEFLMEGQNQMRFASSGKIALETLLLRIIRSHFRIPVDALVRKLADLEQKHTLTLTVPTPLPTTTHTPAAPDPNPVLVSEKETLPPIQPAHVLSISEDPTSTPIAAPAPNPVFVSAKETLPPIQPAPVLSISEDPTPTPEDLGLKAPKKPKAIKSEPPASSQAVSKVLISPEKQSRYDTILQFAAVELEGTIQKKLS